MAKQKRNVSICLGCIEEFSNTELTIVAIHDKLGMRFQSVFCEKCIKSENFPQNDGITIIGPSSKPRKVRAKKEPIVKKTTATKKTTTKKTTTTKKVTKTNKK